MTTPEPQSRQGLSIEQALEKQGMLICPVEGNSMMPFLCERTDVVRLVPTKGLLNKYDLPLYRRPNGALVLHRIIKVKKKHYVICGDNRQFYERVPHEWVIALAVGRYRDGEYLSFDEDEHRTQITAICAARDGFRGRCRAGFAKTKIYWKALKKKLFR